MQPDQICSKANDEGEATQTNIRRGKENSSMLVLVQHRLYETCLLMQH